MSQGTRVQDLYDNKKDFENILREAESSASGEWEENFVCDISDKYFNWGFTMYLSETQRDILERIANK